MTIAEELARIQANRNTIRNKLVSLGKVESSATLDACATAVDGIVDNGAVNAEVKEGETYTVPAGYHNGSGTVKGVSGGGSYNLQTKTATPTKNQQSITPDSGYYGLSAVTVAAIPEAYQDVSSVTATAADVLANKTFVTPDGTLTPGTMQNNGAVSATLDTETTEYAVPEGYHTGAGKVSVATETKSATPTKSEQTVSASAGKVLKSVTVSAIPDAYQDVTGVTATAAHVLDGEKFVDSAGNLTEGTMTDNGAISKTIDGLTATSATIPAGYTSGGTVSLTDDILNALKAI